VQGFRVLHLTYDTYFNETALYPVTTGLTMGLLPSKTLQAEGGFDLLYPTVSPSGPIKVPVLLNAKGSPEDAYFGLARVVGRIFNVGFENDVTDYDITRWWARRSRVSARCGRQLLRTRDLFKSSKATWNAPEFSRAGSHRRSTCR
jgi:hypothetical protein